MSVLNFHSARNSENRVIAVHFQNILEALVAHVPVDFNIVSILSLCQYPFPLLMTRSELANLTARIKSLDLKMFAQFQWEF